MSIIALLVVAGFALYVMTPGERLSAMRPALVTLRAARGAVDRWWRGFKWLGVGFVTGNPWAVTVGVLMILLVLNAPTQRVAWPTLSDVRPEIERLIAVEEHTARVYDAAVAQFKLGALSADGLTRIIKTSLIPELQDVTLRLQSINQISAEHRALLTHAKEYLQLRSESWRLRAEALERHNLAELKTAEQIESISLQALARVKRRETR